jgi:hypothetical protein
VLFLVSDRRPQTWRSGEHYQWRSIGDGVPDQLEERVAFHEHARTSANSLQLRHGLSFDAWAGVGTRLGRISNASSWWLGDWLLYGERTYGKRYTEALAVTQLDYQTLRNYAWVSRRFEPSRRRERVSFQHHAELAALPEADQDLWLQRCQRLGWSRNELRRQMRVAGRPETFGRHDAHTVRVPVTTDRERLWRQAAAAADQDLEDWIAAAADEAANAVLQPPTARREQRAVSV